MYSLEDLENKTVILFDKITSHHKMQQLCNWIGKKVKKYTHKKYQQIWSVNLMVKIV